MGAPFTIATEDQFKNDYPAAYVVVDEVFVQRRARHARMTFNVFKNVEAAADPTALPFRVVPLELDGAAFDQAFGPDAPNPAVHALLAIIYDLGLALPQFEGAVEGVE